MTRARISARLGFIGLGNMGSPMAVNLLAAGHRLVVHDVRRAAAAKLIERGAEWADSPADVLRRTEMVCLSLPGPKEMEAIIEGLGGLLAAAHPGSLLIDFTTNSPLLVRGLHARLAALGAGLVDAPVSGGVTGARSRRQHCCACILCITHRRGHDVRAGCAVNTLQAEGWQQQSAV